MKKWFDLLKEAYNEWSADNAFRLAAALSYYAFTSLIPLLLVLAALGSFFLHFTNTGQDLKQQMINYIASSVGEGGGEGGQITQLLNQALQAQEDAAATSIISSIIGFVTALFGASVIFSQLYEALNTIWDVPEENRPQGIWATIRAKLLGFALVLGLAVLLLVSTILSSLLQTILTTYQLTPPWLYGLINIIVQLLVLSFVFATLFKYLPDVEAEWREVLVGGAVTAVLFLIGQYLLTLYFSTVGSTSSYGIIGGVLAFLLYVYYASLIIFFGAEFAQVYAQRYGSLSRQLASAGGQGISPEAALVVQNIMAGNERELVYRGEKLEEAKNKQYAAAAAGSLAGLLFGAVVGAIGLVVGLGRGLSRLRS
jgi:membrane protein